MPLYPSVVIGAALLALVTPASIAAQAATDPSDQSATSAQGAPATQGSSSTHRGAAKAPAKTTSTSDRQSTTAKRTAAAKNPASDDSPVSLDRIREGVMRAPRIELPDFGVPTFRISVQQDTIKLPGEYDKRNAVGDTPGYFFSNAHQEFLNMSSPSGLPVQQAGGIPVLALVSSLKKGFRDREAARVRAQIQDELEQLDPEAARARRASSPPRD